MKRTVESIEVSADSRMNTKPYHYLESGLPNVWLMNGFTVHGTDYGSGVSIDDVAVCIRLWALLKIQSSKQDKARAKNCDAAYD